MNAAKKPVLDPRARLALMKFRNGKDTTQIAREMQCEESLVCRFLSQARNEETARTEIPAEAPS